jgi:hypothetical protein
VAWFETQKEQSSAVQTPRKKNLEVVL